MAKSNQSNNDPNPPVKKTALDRIKAVGNVVLGIGQTTIGVAVLALELVSQVAGGSSGSSLGSDLTSNGMKRITSPYGKNNKTPKNQLPQQRYSEAQSIGNQIPKQNQQMDRTLPQNTPVTRPIQQQQMRPHIPQQNLPMARALPQNIPTARPIQQQPMKAEQKTRGMAGELWHKIKSNPIKTLVVAVVAVSFPPAGTALAGAILMGTAAKSAYDSHVNKKNARAMQNQSYTQQPHRQTMGSQSLSPTNSPNLKQQRGRGQSL